MHFFTSANSRPCPAPVNNRHILIANNIYPPIMAGGAEIIVANLAEGLAAQGHRVTVLSTCGPEMEPHPVEARNGVTVLRFFPKNLYWSFTRGERSGAQKALWHLRDAWNLTAGEHYRAILAEQKPDLLHTHLIDGMSATLWRRARQAKIPVLHTAHDYHLLCPRAFMLTRSLALCTRPQLGCSLYRRWHLHTAREVDLFCSPSRFLLDKHLESGLQAKATAVVRNGIVLPKIDTATKPSDKTRFLFPARLTLEKGCRVLLEAIKLLPKEFNGEIIVAGKGALAEDFIAAAATDPRLRYVGYVSGDEKEALFQSAHVLLLPSLWYENAPVVIVEAAAYGMAVIGSHIGAIPEFIRDQETGLLFEAGNPQALAEAMLKLARQPELISCFAANAQTLRDECSLENMIGNYSAHYKRLLS
jgi:glycosyltransferase involved in cell wall biosynthesis